MADISSLNTAVAARFFPTVSIAGCIVICSPATTMNTGR